MAVASLRFRANATDAEENKFGFVVFDGKPHEYHYWLFRFRLKMASCPSPSPNAKPEEIRFLEEKRKDVMRQVIENLRGDALGVAMDVGIDDLLDDGGAKALEDAMLKHIFPIYKNGAKALYNEGHKNREGVLIRQPGESMGSYINRRRRWWTLLKQLDTTVSILSLIHI